MNIVGRFKVENLLVSTILADDSNVYETGIASSYYNDDHIVIVETYQNFSEALKGHNSWVKVMNVPFEKLPQKLIASHSTFLSMLAELAGCQTEFYKTLPIEELL